MGYGQPPNADRNREIERLWLLGFSGGVIAQRMKPEYPEITRNMIIGVAHRLQLPQRPHTQRFDTTSGRKKKPKVVAPPPPPLPPPPQSAPPPRHLDLMAINDSTCRWPVTHDSPFLFCGAAVQQHSPYCGFHQSIARVGPPKVKA